MGVAVGRPELHRDAAVGVGREDEQRLLQIRAVVLRIPLGNRWRAAARSTGPLIAVLPTEGDGGAVVVQAPKSQLEQPSDRDDDCGPKREILQR